MASQEVLTRTLVELADTLVDDFDIVDLLTTLTERCCEAFGITDAGLVLASPIGGDLRVMASTSATMRNLELYELQAQDGPCLDCYRDGDPVENIELEAATTRWPRFAPVALAAGFQSVSAMPMRLRGTTIGALNLFQDEPSGMPPDDLSAARAFADVATIAILQHQAAHDAREVNDQLNHALHSRVTIEQAKGMLAERAELDVDEAFTQLRSYARHNNRRLVEVAQAFLDGDLDVEEMHLSSTAPADAVRIRNVRGVALTSRDQVDPSAER